MQETNSALAVFRLKIAARDLSTLILPDAEQSLRSLDSRLYPRPSAPTPSAAVSTLQLHNLCGWECLHFD